MSRRAAKKIATARKAKAEFNGVPWHGSSQHPSSRQATPEVPGAYLIQSCPGDVWRRANWCEGAFYLGAVREPWFAWKPIGEESGETVNTTRP